MRASLLAVGWVLVLGGCYRTEPPYRPDLSSFKVEISNVYVARAVPQDGEVKYGDPGTPLPVVSRCQQQYGGEALVPKEVRGTPGCRYAIPRGGVDLEVKVVALGRDGELLKTFTGPISFRVVPGDLTGGYPYRTLQMKDGVGSGVVKVAHLYSDVRVWAEDKEPDPIFSDGGVATDGKPIEPEERTYATSSAPAVWFEDPTLAKVQIPDGFDNRSSPFVGQFITIGRAKAENSEPVLQSCENDPEHDGKPALLIVTGTDPSGFFVTDLNACRVPEQVPNQYTAKEPDGFFPGTFGSMFIYNYSFPEGLDVGDALWSVAGSVQEFTSTTQLTFPSWVVAENVRTLPEAQWGKYLDRVPIPVISGRTCGLSDAADPYLTDVLCGHNKANLKMESVESALVQLKRVRFAQTFVNCDRNGDGEVPFFCETRDDNGAWSWSDCDFSNEGTLTPEELEEVACNIDCVTGQGDFARTLCSERATFTGFGQFVMELSGPGPAEAGLDATLPQRIETVAISTSSRENQRTWGTNTQVRVWCNTPVRYRFGGPGVVATASDAALAANTLLEHFIEPGQDRVALVADGDLGPNPACQVALNPHTRINLVTKDAVPELRPDCDPADPNAAAAAQCVALRAATYDVRGHLRHLQPGRPRWVVLPRDKDDICCYPGPGLSCPTPIKPCQ